MFYKLVRCIDLFIFTLVTCINLFLLHKLHSSYNECALNISIFCEHATSSDINRTGYKENSGTAINKLFSFFLHAITLNLRTNSSLDTRSFVECKLF